MKVSDAAASSKLWKFKEFVSSGGRPQILEWREEMSFAVRAIFDDRIDTLAKLPRADWQFPEFSLLRGKEGRQGLSEIRWFAEDKQWRVIGFFGPGKMEYTMLISCTHKQKRYNPDNCLETAIKRKRAIEQGERSTTEYA
jgi:hypothetical protein